jgi:hypothetical protein
VPGPLLHVSASVLCAHGGPATTVSSNARVLVSGMPVATVVDQTLVAGCAFNVSGGPHPCMRVQWAGPAARVLVLGQPALLQTSPGIGVAADQAPQGPVVVGGVQPRVVGT